MANINQIKKELRQHADPIRAKLSQRYFKTGKGQYGYGDVFLGLTVPEVRAVVRRNKDAGLLVIERLISSKIHEERLTGLLILVNKYQAGDKSEKKTIAKFYLAHRKFINNWDLVDLSAHKIIGEYLFDKSRVVLTKLANSGNLWDRRIAIMSTAYFIGKNEFDETIKIARILLQDDHDLIHKAVGWMLREIGKRSLETEEAFLVKYYKKMPRTMLRYAIEKFPEKKRIAYLHNEI